MSVDEIRKEAARFRERMGLQPHTGIGWIVSKGERFVCACCDRRLTDGDFALDTGPANPSRVFCSAKCANVVLDREVA